MENLLKRIKDEALISRKEKDSFRSDTLLTLWSEAAMVGKNNGNRKSTDEEVLKVIIRFKKGIIDTISLLSKASGVEERIAKLEKEIKIYDEFLPKQLTEAELRTILLSWKETNYPDTPNMGGFMAALKRCYDGQYDGKMASTILKEIL
jgi:uncharacterized protein YqeY